MQQRQKNFSDVDKLLLISIINDNNLIDSLIIKNNNATSIKKRESAWQSIVQQFNAQAKIHRSEKQLVVLWRDLKAKGKRAYAEQKRERVKTGGGSAAVVADPISNAVIDILPSSILDPILGVNDCDAGLHEYNLEESTGADHFPNELQQSTSVAITTSHFLPSPRAPETTSAPSAAFYTPSVKRNSIKEYELPCSSLENKENSVPKRRLNRVTEEDLLTAKMKAVGQIMDHQRAEHEARMKIYSVIEHNLHNSKVSTETQTIPIKYMDLFDLPM